MKFLTKVLVEKSTTASLRLFDPYAWHKVIWKTFPNREDKIRNFLFRMDAVNAEFRLYVLSEYEPEAPDWGRWESKPVATGFLKHGAYRFQLKANPTMRRSSDRRRLGIYDETRLREWMTRKAEQHGFVIDDENLVLDGPQDTSFIKKNIRGKMVSVDFSGTLRVGDLDKFRAAFGSGIGSGKAFGFGLLMLQPLNG